MIKINFNSINWLFKRLNFENIDYYNELELS